MNCLCGKLFNSENDLNFHIVTMCQSVDGKYENYIDDSNIPDIDLNISLEENTDYSSSEHQDTKPNQSDCPSEKHKNTNVNNLITGIKRPIKKTRHSDTRHSETRHSDTRHSETRHSDTSHSNTKHSDTRHSDTKHSDTRHSNTRHSNTKHSNTGHSDTGHSDTRHSNTKHSDTKIYKCPCGKIYYTKKKLLHHKKNSCFDPNVKVYKCICRKKFVTRRGYICHKRKSCTVIVPKIECVCNKINCVC